MSAMWRQMESVPAGAQTSAAEGWLSRFRFHALLLIFCLLVQPSLALAAEPLITVEELLAKVSERAKEQNSKPSQREFLRTTTTLELNKKEKVRKKEELTYRMVIIDGALYPRLIQKNGRALTAEEQRKEEDKEAAFRADQGRKTRKEEGNTVLLRLSGENARRFNYAITGTDRIEGREVFIVTVTPKPGLSAKTIEEQVMARISGRLWIDQVEHEIAKLELQLMKPIHFGIGLLGALHQFEFNVCRKRLPDGEWENSTVDVSLHFRVLVDTHRIRYEEKVSALPPGLASQ